MHISVIGSGKMGKDISILLSQSIYIDEINLISLHTEINKKETELKNYLNNISSVFEKKLNVDIDRKMLAELAMHEPSSFKFLVEKAKTATK